MLSYTSYAAHLSRVSEATETLTHKGIASMKKQKEHEGSATRSHDVTSSESFVDTLIGIIDPSTGRIVGMSHAESGTPINN